MANSNLTAVESFRRRRWLTLLGLAAAAFILFKLLLSLLLSDMGVFTLLDLHRTRRDLQQEIADLQEKNAKLADQVQALRSDPVYIEALAREQLGMVRPGERVYRLVPRESASSPVTSPMAPDAPSREHD
ncbi:MAG TPA: septum formation initiator family protein [Nitrospiria bacterium]|nr:septum formation initiator family protein [Nitrospiria bacterium]